MGLNPTVRRRRLYSSTMTGMIGYNNNAEICRPVSISANAESIIALLLLGADNGAELMVMVMANGVDAGEALLTTGQTSCLEWIKIAVRK